jgi:PAS domain S-box-containing protein
MMSHAVRDGLQSVVASQAKTSSVMSDQSHPHPHPNLPPPPAPSPSSATRVGASAIIQASLTEWERERLALNQHAIVSVTDASGTITYVNHRFCQISGYTQAELMGQNHRLLKSGEHSAAYFQALWETISQGRVWQGEICNRRKDGSLYWVESTITPFLDDKGLPCQYVSIRTDVTRIKAAEAAYKAQNAMQEVVSKAAGHLLAAEPEQLDAAIERCLQLAGENLVADRAYLCQLEPDGSTLSNSHEWCAPGVAALKPSLQGVKLQDLASWWGPMQQGLGINIPDVAAMPAATSSLQSQLQALGLRAVCAYPMRRGERAVGFVGFEQVTQAREWDARAPKLLSLLADLIDSALLRRAAQWAQQDATAAAKERLRRGQLYANIGTWEWNTQTHELFWTERIAPLFGHPQGDLETTYDNFLAAVHPQDRQAVVDAVNACVERDVPYQIEHRVVWPDGTVRWLLERGGVQRDEQGRALKMFGMVQDIDDRKRAEFALVAAREEAERANRAKSEFLSRMSHELRTPLNAILGFGQLMELDASLPAEQRDNVQEIMKAGHHLLRLINEVLDLAKVEAGRIELSIEDTELQEVVQNSLSLMQPMAASRGIAVQCADLSGWRVHADRIRLKQVLLNLLSNAIKYNREQGAVLLQAQAGAPGMLRLTVQDTGLGIPSHQLGLLFEPFQRLHADDPAIEGTGIGLTITRRLVELMGGRIGADSQVGVGSAFWVELPLQQAASGSVAHAASADDAAAQAAQAAQAPQAAQAALPARRPEAELAAGAGQPAVQTPGYTVLYIEDNPANIQLMVQIMGQRPQVELFTAQQASRGIELALACQPDLVLLDIGLPTMDGYQVLAVLRQLPALRRVPVVALSANALPQDIERGLAAGFTDYLTKPLDVGRFLAVLDTFLGLAKEEGA